MNKVEDFSNEQGDQLENESSLWVKLLDEIVEKILVYTIKTSNQKLENYHSLSRACSRFNLIMQRRKHIFHPRVYIKFPDDEIKEIIHIEW